METTPLVENLIARELRAEEGDGAAARAAFRVCEKMRQPLCLLAGTAGYRSLIGRALTLARPRAPWLTGVRIAADGTLEFPADTEAPHDRAEAAPGAAMLVAELLGLLFTLIGSALTLRLVSNVWPGAGAGAPLSETKTDPS